MAQDLRGPSFSVLATGLREKERRKERGRKKNEGNGQQMLRKTHTHTHTKIIKAWILDSPPGLRLRISLRISS